MQLQFFDSAIRLDVLDGEIRETRLVSPLDVSRALASTISMETGLLPPDVVWWGNNRNGPLWAFWEPPQTRKVALQLKAFEAPERMELAFPGALFFCKPNAPPWLWACPKRPENLEQPIFHFPAYNIFGSGRTCPGSHKYPPDVGLIPADFFMSFFTPAGDIMGRSKKHPENLSAMWREQIGQPAYPLGDLERAGTVREAIESAFEGAQT